VWPTLRYRPEYFTRRQVRAKVSNLELVPNRKQGRGQDAEFVQFARGRCEQQAVSARAAFLKSNESAKEIAHAGGKHVLLGDLEDPILPILSG
jgi:hypothetical protein